MLKAYFDIFNATEEQLTPKAIGRLKFASFLGMFLMPHWCWRLNSPSFSKSRWTWLFHHGRSKH